MAQILAATQCHNCSSTTRVVSTDQAGNYCVDCLVRLIVNGSLEVYEEGYTNCESCGDGTATYCESCATPNCSNCGYDGAEFCSADCALSYNGDDERPSCGYCGDSSSYYCSPRCAYRDTGETMCTSCEEETLEATCPDCIADSEEDGPRPMPLLQLRDVAFVAVAAQPIAGVDDNSVSMDGITFDFEM